MLKAGPIGVFDSGYGGLTILSEIQSLMPEYDYCYLGDNSRAPYGSRSFDVVYEFTKQAVLSLFDMGCNLVILACNTASAKALRTIQQKDLPHIDPDKRVLGVIRPTAEIIGPITQSRHVGILGTTGTIQSESYSIEINKLFPDIKVSGEACPMWVPLVENREYENEGADYFIKKNLANILSKDPLIDTLILGCTHYPILLNKIKSFLPDGVTAIAQGEYIARSLKDYLHRHPEMDNVCTKGGATKYFTTESSQKFSEAATIFLNKEIEVERITLE
ncbi:MAG: glutamate racemase [Prevotella sp.]|jgi:glutamate racemase|uniref:Glutamate racemase n=1 Tax=uncultured Dysgonomonas sp. TaxID=206096 RepID=A0A212JA35_9BACT|nr:glutamate racemase [uncultured Dysgonomonas sp.]MDR1503275.1 glutamate racemase [Prevotella sp.]SBV96085.1 Glutamate racemase [uncultured Dysgonomonas sp.]